MVSRFNIVAGIRGGASHWWRKGGIVGVLLATGLAVGAAAQETQQTASQEDSQEQTAMQCPMMEAMGSLALHADSPAVLLGQAGQLELTAEQQQQLERIAASAREQARQVLTAAQREQLEGAPSGRLSPMQLMHTQMKGRMEKMKEMKMKMQAGTDGKPQMCPMCMQMMEKRMADDAQTRNAQQDEEHKQHHKSQGQR